jgi:hypothetical protein
MVILLGVVLLAVGALMLSGSGSFLRHSTDARARLRARFAADGIVALQMAKLDQLKDSLIGSNLVLNAVPTTDLGTPDGEDASAEAVRQGTPAGQELITSGPFTGLRGQRVPFLVRGKGMSGQARADVEAQMFFYQIPIFQFGVFFDGELEITPGPNMTVFGPVHTNSNAYFRGYAGRSLTFQGPVSATGSIYQWVQPTGQLLYYATPQAGTGTLVSGLTNSMAPMGISPAPGNVSQGDQRLVLPIGGSTPRELITACTGTETDALRRQKFDCMGAGSYHYHEGTSTRPTWLSLPNVFFERRENRWVRFRDIDLRAALAATRDSIFYFSDGTTVLDHGSQGLPMIEAFRITNAATLPRNVTIASGNPIYLVGDFNLPDPHGTCGPANVPSPASSEKYCNAMIASDAFTVLSSAWSSFDYAARGMAGTLEQPASAGSWVVSRTWDSIPQQASTSHTSKPPAIVRTSNTEQTWGFPSLGGSSATGFTNNGVFTGTLTINAAILTGTKPTPSTFLAPTTTSDATYNSGTEGGWIGTLRFLEDLGSATVVFNGSFVCLWNSASPGLDMSNNLSFQTFSLRTDLNSGHTLPYSTQGYFTPPTRTWGYDPRFRDIDNMPPGTPFLATGIYSNYGQSQ